MAPTPRDLLYEGVAIDATGVLTDSDGEPIELRISGGREIALHIEGDEAASYAVEAGVRLEDGSVRWFDTDQTYDAAGTVNDRWTHPEQLVRVIVTAAAETADSTADVYLSMV